jgi:hypothetical protein
VAEVKDRRRALCTCGIFGFGETLVRRILTHCSLGGRGGSADLTALGQMVRENGSLPVAGDLPLQGWLPRPASCPDKGGPGSAVAGPGLVALRAGSAVPSTTPASI